MPIVSTEVIGPSVQADESHRGSVRYSFDDGRVEHVRVRSKDKAAWDALLLTLPVIVTERVIEQESQESAAAERDVATTNHAGVKKVLLAHLRAAFTEQESYIAYRKFLRVNNYRLAQGWSVNQIGIALESEGLTVEEWAKIKTRFQYLFNPARVTAMTDYVTVRNGDPR